MTRPRAATSSAQPPLGRLRTCVIVPCFNEAERLRPADFRAYLQGSADVDLLFVDDGSSDATREILERLSEGLPDRCSLLVLEANRGKGEAVRRGLCTALERQHTRCVGYWDADLATPLEEIEQMRSILERREDVDIVLGIRTSLLGHRFRHATIRKLLGRLFAVVVSLLLGRRFHDTQCGAKLFRATPALRQALRDGFVSRWIFDIELLLRCESGKPTGETRFAKIYEYPLESWRGRNRSKVTPWSYASALVELPVVVWRYRTGTRQ